MRNKKYIQQTLVAIVFISSLGACDSCFFKQTATGLPYKVARKGEGPKPQDGEVVILNMRYKTPHGKVLFNSAEHDIPLAFQYYDSLLQKDGGLQEALGMLQKGDELIFKLDAKTLLGDRLEQAAAQHKLAEKTVLLLYLHAKDIMPAKKWEEEQYAILQAKWKAKGAEQLQKDIVTIDSYLQEHKIIADTTTSGLRYVIDKPGKGSTPRAGNTVKVNYLGKTLTGNVFDTSLAETAAKHGIHNPRRTYGPIEFRLGAGAVIPGWEEGIALLNKGAKARLFIPSTLAYGEGAIGAHIKPNTVLIFEVELVDIL